MKKLFVIFLNILFLFGLCLFSGCNKEKYSAETDPTRYLEFSLLEDGTYRVDGFVDLSVLHLVIPSTYNNIPVTTIRNSAFEPQRGIWGGIYTAPIESVIIEEGITTVGSEAFVDCGAKSFILPDSIIEVGSEAFNLQDSYTINYPINVKHIGDLAFCHANFTDGVIEIDGVTLQGTPFQQTNVKKVVFSSVYKELPHGIFQGCGELEEVVLPTGLESIPSHAFYQCLSLKEIVLDENIKEIEESAFYQCLSLKEIVIGENIKEIEEYAFFNSGLEKVSFKGENIWIEPRVFGSCKNLNALELNDVYIDGCQLGNIFELAPLKNVTISESSRYKLIDGAICEDNNIWTVLLLGRSNFNSFDKINMIDGYAFLKCEFDELIVPDTVTGIGEFAFAYAAINNLVYSAKVISNKAFYYATIQSASIFTEHISGGAFEDVKELKTLHIGNGCKEIASQAFICLFDLEEVYISETVEKIETAAFIQCHSLKDVYYLKKDTPIVDLHAGTFIIYISNIVTEDHRIKATINEDFKIHVSNQIYDECVKLWSDMENDSKYIYHESLKEHIIVDKERL